MICALSEEEKKKKFRHRLKLIMLFYSHCVLYLLILLVLHPLDNPVNVTAAYSLSLLLHGVLFVLVFCTKFPNLHNKQLLLQQLN